jgi:nucleoside 2-deoxyribosyltransferase
MKKCDLILIVLDGRTVDEGAAFELGYVFAMGKPCYGLQTDVRRLLLTGNNPMLDCSLLQVFQDTEELIHWAQKYTLTNVPTQFCEPMVQEIP